MFLKFLLSLLAIGGTYHIDGYDPYSNIHYKGKAHIKEVHHGVYQAKWVVFGRVYKGTGIREGQKISFLFMLDDHKISGVEVYNIEGDLLKGRFVPLGGNIIGYETLTKK